MTAPVAEPEVRKDPHVLLERGTWPEADCRASTARARRWRASQRWRARGRGRGGRACRTAGEGGVGGGAPARAGRGGAGRVEPVEIGGRGQPLVPAGAAQVQGLAAGDLA